VDKVREHGVLTYQKGFLLRLPVAPTNKQYEQEMKDFPSNWDWLRRLRRILTCYS